MCDRDESIEVIDEDKLVCFCKKIKYRTIKEAVLNGAYCIELVRAKTRANTGCATLCTAQVEGIIAKYKTR